MGLVNSDHFSPALSQKKRPNLGRIFIILRVALSVTSEAVDLNCMRNKNTDGDEQKSLQFEISNHHHILGIL